MGSKFEERGKCLFITVLTVIFLSFVKCDLYLQHFFANTYTVLYCYNFFLGIWS